MFATYNNRVSLRIDSETDKKLAGLQELLEKEYINTKYLKKAARENSIAIILSKIDVLFELYYGNLPAIYDELCSLYIHRKDLSKHRRRNLKYSSYDAAFSVTLGDIKDLAKSKETWHFYRVGRHNDGGAYLKHKEEFLGINKFGVKRCDNEEAIKEIANITLNIIKKIVSELHQHPEFKFQCEYYGLKTKVDEKTGQVIFANPENLSSESYVDERYLERIKEDYDDFKEKLTRGKSEKEYVRWTETLPKQKYYGERHEYLYEEWSGDVDLERRTNVLDFFRSLKYANDEDGVCLIEEKKRFKKIKATLNSLAGQYNKAKKFKERYDIVLQQTIEPKTWMNSSLSLEEQRKKARVEMLKRMPKEERVLFIKSIEESKRLRQLEIEKENEQVQVPKWREFLIPVNSSDDIKIQLGQQRGRINVEPKRHSL